MVNQTLPDNNTTFNMLKLPQEHSLNKRSIAVLGDQIPMEHGSHNRLSVRDKARTEIESSKAQRKIYRFVKDWEKARSNKNKHAIKTQSNSC